MRVLKTESQVTKEVFTFLNSIPGLWYWKVSDRYTSGVPDIVGCFKGRMFAMELKRPGAKARKLQEYVLQEIADSGGVSGVVTSAKEASDLLFGSVQL